LPLRPREHVHQVRVPLLQTASLPGKRHHLLKSPQGGAFTTPSSRSDEYKAPSGPSIEVISISDGDRLRLPDWCRAALLSHELGRRSSYTDGSTVLPAIRSLRGDGQADQPDGVSLVQGGDRGLGIGTARPRRPGDGAPAPDVISRQLRPHIPETEI
jgi:hypothetical protein